MDDKLFIDVFYSYRRKSSIITVTKGQLQSRSFCSCFKTRQRFFHASEKYFSVRGNSHILRTNEKLCHLNGLLLYW